MKMTKASPEQISQEAKQIWNAASRIPGENLTKRLLNLPTMTSNVIWLGETKSEQPPVPQPPY